MALITKKIKGTEDVLPKQSYRWQFVENIMREESRAYGFREMRTPVFEHTELFARGVGQTTDVVQKEMYTFDTKGGESVGRRERDPASRGHRRRSESCAGARARKRGASDQGELLCVLLPLRKAAGRQTARISPVRCGGIRHAVAHCRRGADLSGTVGARPSRLDRRAFGAEFHRLPCLPRQIQRSAARLFRTIQRAALHHLPVALGEESHAPARLQESRGSQNRRGSARSPRERPRSPIISARNARRTLPRCSAISPAQALPIPSTPPSCAAWTITPKPCLNSSPTASAHRALSAAAADTTA